MKKIKPTERNNFIIMDLLMRRMIILQVRVMRAAKGLPLLAPVIPLSYLMEERLPHQINKLLPTPEWFKGLDLESVSCYDLLEKPTRGMIEREETCNQLQKRLDDFSNSERQ